MHGEETCAKISNVEGGCKVRDPIAWSASGGPVAWARRTLRKGDKHTLRQWLLLSFGNCLLSIHSWSGGTIYFENCNKIAFWKITTQKHSTSWVSYMKQLIRFYFVSRCLLYCLWLVLHSVSQRSMKTLLTQWNYMNKKNCEIYIIQAHISAFIFIWTVQTPIKLINPNWAFIIYAAFSLCTEALIHSIQ